MSGFVYIWFDRKRRMFYIGRHWGDESDGYICSNKRMLAAYNKRPEDFKRRILKKILSCQEDLKHEEQRWLDFIFENEYGTRYYNLNSNAFGGTISWTPERRKKFSRSMSKTRKTPEYKEKMRRPKPRKPIIRGENWPWKSDVKAHTVKIKYHRIFGWEEIT